MNHILRFIFYTMLSVIGMLGCEDYAFCAHSELCTVSFKENFYQNGVKNNVVDNIYKKLHENNVKTLSYNMVGVDLKIINRINSRKINRILKINKIKYVLLGKVRKIKSGLKLKVYIYDVNSKSVLSTSKLINKVRNDKITENLNSNYVKKVLINLFIKKTNYISKIYVIGNDRTKKMSIFKVINNCNFRKSLWNIDIQKYTKLIYSIGCFDTVYVSCEKYNEDFVLVVMVKETPIINRIFFEEIGLKDEILKNNLVINEGLFFELNGLAETIEKLKKFFESKNYCGTAISYSIQKLEDNRINLKFFFDYKKDVFVKKISFYGNKSFSFATLRSIVKISKKNVFYLLTGMGKLNELALLDDCNEISNFYRSKGFINVKVSLPIVNIKNNECAVIFVIEEGNCFKIENCLLSGDVAESEKFFLKKLNSFRDRWVNLNNVQLDILKLLEEYYNIGYSDVQVYPEIISNSITSKDLVFRIKKNEKKNVKHIEISGNDKTSDFVIRRELVINEDDAYSVKKIENSIYNLKKLNYFESVNSKKIKYEDTKNIGVSFNVKEKPTGQISFGAGYSTSEKFFINGSIFKDNFMGKGTSLRISGTIGNENDKYNIMFNEPWLFNTSVSTTLSFYKEVETNVNNSINKQKHIDSGFYIGVSYPVITYVRLSFSYNYNVSKNKVKGIVSSKLERKYTISSTTLSASYDSRRGIFYTKKGALYKVVSTYAGFRGNLNFVKTELNLGHYFQLYREAVLHVRGKYGQIKDLYSQEKKVYRQLREKDFFRQGGMSSVRAYDYNTIGTKTIKDSTGSVISSKGGTQYLLFNFELIYPLKKEINLLAVIFYDAGQVYDRRMSEFKDGVGCGIRWYSPIGPIRLEAAYKVNDPDKELKWNFAIGAPF